MEGAFYTLLFTLGLHTMVWLGYMVAQKLGCKSHIVLSSMPHGPIERLHPKKLGVAVAKEEARATPQHKHSTFPTCCCCPSGWPHAARKVKRSCPKCHTACFLPQYKRRSLHTFSTRSGEVYMRRHCKCCLRRNREIARIAFFWVTLFLTLKLL